MRPFMTDAQVDNLVDEIKRMSGITDSEYDDLLKARLPVMLEYLEPYCNRTFDKDKIPGGVKLYLESSFSEDVSHTDVKTEKMGTLSFTYFTPEEAPKRATDFLKGLRKPGTGRRRRA